MNSMMTNIRAIEPGIQRKEAAEYVLAVAEMVMRENWFECHV